MKNLALAVRDNRVRLVVIVALLAIAIVGAFRYANTSKAEAASGTQAQVASNGAPAGSASTPSPSSSGGCCGSGGSVTPVEGTAVLAGGIQKISVDLSSGNYNPNVLLLKAGVPAEVTFGQGSGCMGYVQSPDLGFQADLTGGPQTVRLPALQAGQYNFACGMGMVPGLIVVQ